jgi:hypothetical protein
VAALDGRRLDGRRIVAAERLLRVARLGPATAVTPGAPADARFARRVLDRLTRRDRTPDERREVLAERRTDWSALLNLLGEAPLGREEADPLATLRTPGWVLETFEVRALADAAPDDLVVVLGEGFVQRGRLFCGNQPDDARLDRFVAAVPPATLQVHVTADVGILVRRLQQRSRVNDRHVGLGTSDLAKSVERDAELLELLAARLRTRGDAVLEVPTVIGEQSSSADTVVERLATVLA